MKPVYILSIFLIFIIGSSTCSKINLKEIPSIRKNRLLQTETDTDTNTDATPDSNSTYYDPEKKSSGLSAGSICAIAIPCIAALVGVGAAAAILGGGASAAATGPVLVNPVPSLPPPTYVDTTAAQLMVPQEIPVQPQIIQPVEVPPQPVQQVIQPIPKVETPVVNIPQQPVVVQPQLVPVQQMQLVPVQQVEMVPVQHVEMVPVQEVVPTYQAAAEVVPQVTQVTQVSQMPEISGTQISQSIGQGIQQGVQEGFGIQGGDFITAPEGYGTSVIQGSSNPLNLGEFSSQNLM
jgi:hypothetical protein